MLPTNGSTATALSVDLSGTLWVADSAGSAVYGYTATQLASSGSPAPAYRLTAPDTLVAPVGLVTSDEFLVADAGSNAIWGYNTVSGPPSGSPDGEIIPTGIGRLTSMTAGGAGIWLSDGSDSVALFSGGGAPITVFVVPGAGAHVSAMTVDNNGDLWVATSGNNQLFEYSAANIPSAINVSPTASFTLSVAPSTLLFNPSGWGFGINPQRVHAPSRGTPLSNAPNQTMSRRAGRRSGGT